MVLKDVYTVDKNGYDDSGGERDMVIYVCSTREEAERRVKRLNEEYAFGIILDEDGLDAKDCPENSDALEGLIVNQYYNVGSFNIDEPFFLDDK